MYVVNYKQMKNKKYIKSEVLLALNGLFREDNAEITITKKNGFIKIVRK